MHRYSVDKSVNFIENGIKRLDSLFYGRIILSLRREYLVVFL